MSSSGSANPAGLRTTEAEDHSPGEVIPVNTDLQATKEVKTGAVEKSTVNTCEVTMQGSSDGINGPPDDAMDLDAATPGAAPADECTSTKPTTVMAKLAAVASSSAAAASAAAPVLGCSSARERSVTVKSQIPSETMFIIQDKMILLHRIVVRAVCYWNQKVSFFAIALCE